MQYVKRSAFSLLALLALSGSLLSQAPTAPANLTISTMMGGMPMLRWDTSAGALGYRIYRALDTMSYSAVGLVERNAFVDFFAYPHATYRYYVTALNHSGESSPSDTVAFSPGHPPHPPVFGTVRGTVADDSSGAPLEGAMVEFFKPIQFWKTRFALTDSLGHYSAGLDTGVYLLRATRFGYPPQWYKNVAGPVDATPVTVQALATDTVDFALHRFPVPVPVHIAGTVSDSGTGNPLKDAFVLFLRPNHEFLEIEHMIGLFGGFRAERVFIPELGHMHGVVWAGKTDTAGKYTATVPSGLRYIALAFKGLYELKFYDSKRTPFDADRIFVTGDTAGIDFALVRRPIAPDSIAGTVQDSSGVGIASHVMLIRLTVRGPEAVRYHMTDSLGNFKFEHVVAGKFLLRAIPVDGYRAAWYSMSDCGVSNYHHADTLTVPGSITDLHVCVKPTGSNGFAVISGHIAGGAGTFGAASGSSVTGVVVNAVSVTTGEAVGYDITEPDGSYAIENLPPGTYTLVADREGFTSAASASFTVGQSDPSVAGTTLTLTPDAVLGVSRLDQGTPAAYRLEQNYPNPFNPATSISYALPENSRVSLRVYNVLGQLVATLRNGVEPAGYRSVRFDASALSSGVYFYRLDATSSANPASTFTMIRKLLLLK